MSVSRGEMSVVRGALRLLLAVPLMTAGAFGAVLLSLIPVRYRGARLGPWLSFFVSHAFNRLFNIHSTIVNRELLMNYRGIIIANHSTYLDVMLFVNAAPIRYLTALEIQRKPVVGWFAIAQESVFVNRSSRASRAEARDLISAALQRNPYPPIVIFPEGRLGPGDRLNPFRHGAFELAIENDVPVLPCAIRYSRPDIATWHGGTRGEWMATALWRLACFGGRLEMTLIPLDPIHPSINDDAELLTSVAQRSIELVLGFPPAPLELKAVDRAPWEVE